MKTLATLSAIALLPLAGCRVSENARITIGQDVHLEALDPDSAGSGSLVPPLELSLLTDAHVGFVEEDEIPGRDVILLAPVPGPSLAGMERSAWDRQVFFVPVDHTFHHPTYTFDLDYLPRDGYPPGAYPTALSAVTVPSSGIESQVVESIATPFIAAANSLAIVPWMFFQPPWTLEHSPERAYERYWEQREVTPAEPPEAGAPPAVPPTETDVPAMPEIDADPQDDEGTR